MQETKINLEEIYNRFDYISRVETDSSNIDFKGNMIKAMKEACRQTLELAAENAKIIVVEGGFMEINRGMETESYPTKYVINKQSILDTINQIE